MSDPAKRLLSDYLIRHSHVGEVAEALAEDLIDALTENVALHDRLEAEERRVSAGYVRRSPTHRARQPKPVPPSIDDAWIETGRDRADCA